MLKSGKPLARGISVVSPTISEQAVREMLDTPGVYFPDGHFLYPVTEGERIGNHLASLFVIEPIASHNRFVLAIVDDICRWIESEHVEFDTIFAPAQPAVQTIVEALAARTGRKTAFWEYLPAGWFGSRLVSGAVNPGERVLVLNGVSQQGRCVGERLPGFVSASGGQPVAAAVFAIGTAPGAVAAKERYGKKLYATVEVDINVFSQQECPICKKPGASPPVPWTEMRTQP